VILTQLPLQSLLRRSDYAGRITKWGTSLGAFDIKYMPRIAIKGQVLADLVVEFIEYPRAAVVKEGESVGVQVTTATVLGQPAWKLYFDGAVNQRWFGVGIVLISLERITIEKSLRLSFSATNNEAEYEVLLTEVVMLKRLGGKAVEIFSNLRLIVGQVNGELEARDHRMRGYLNKARQLQSSFESFSI